MTLKTPPVRLVAFLGASAVALLVTGPLMGMVGATGAAGAAAFGATSSLLLFAATTLCLRLSGETLADVGLAFSRRRLVELGIGFLVGAGAFAGASLILGKSVGGAWSLSGARDPLSVLSGIALVLCFFFSEELLFRGYAFRQLSRLYGPRGALALSALLFGVYHLIGSGDWGMGAVFRFALAALGGVVFGYALVRTQSLALPIGLHWGGNWIQASVFGLGHLPGSTTIWVMPLAPAQIRTLTAPDLLPHLPYLAALGLMVLAVPLVARRFPVVSTIDLQKGNS